MTLVEKLLDPIAGKNPCGQDLWLVEGRFRLQQPLEAAWRNGEEPQWSIVRDDATEQLQQSRDLRVAVILCLALFRTEGLAGFCEGVRLVRGLVEKFWDPIYPIPESPTDPIRANTLSNLSAPLGSDTPYQFVKYLRESPLCQTAAGTSFSFADFERAESDKPVEETEGKPTATRDQIEAAFRAAPKEKLRENFRFVSDLLGHVNALIEFCASKKAAASGATFDPLKETLQDVIGVLAPHVEELPPTPQPSPTSAAPQTGAAGGTMLANGIRSRADADAALVAVCDYFKLHEPSSPVPFLLGRARRLLKMDFMQSMSDLAPDVLEKFNSLFGIKESEKKEESTKSGG